MAVTSRGISNVKTLFVFGVLGADALAVIVKNAQAVDTEVFGVIRLISVQSGQLAVY